MCALYATRKFRIELTKASIDPGPVQDESSPYRRYYLSRIHEVTSVYTFTKQFHEK
jgi:hypothetical protein